MPSETDHLLGKSWFLADLSLCEAYLHQFKLVPVCDFSVQAVIVSRIIDLQMTHPEVADHLGILSRVLVADAAALARAVPENPNFVWITCGTSIGLLFHDQIARNALKDGRIVGVAQASAFSAGYAGLVLYEWNSARKEQRGDLGRKIVKFYGGEEFLVEGSGLQCTPPS